MQASTFTLPTPDGVPLFVYRWLPDVPPKAVVQIAHGLAEHAARYARVAEALTRAGYAVYAGDHRGHGRTATTPGALGLFAERDGWTKCIGDLWLINRRIAADHPGLPIVLFGHSLGSFMVQYSSANMAMRSPPRCSRARMASRRRSRRSASCWRGSSGSASGNAATAR